MRIKLSYPWVNPNEADDGTQYRFRVEKVQDSIDYLPGDFLPRALVSALCENSAWEVVIIHLTVLRF